MEFITVTIKDVKNTVPVLINGQKNGFTGKIIKLNKGYVKISADYPKVNTEEVYVSDTTINKPTQVVLICS